MSRLTDNEIKNIILANGFKPHDISTYENMNSKIWVEHNGGLFATTIHDLKKDNFKNIIETINNLGYIPIEIINYQNKNSNITIQCREGHNIITSINEISNEKYKCPTCIGKTMSTYIQSGIIPNKNGYRIIAFDQSSNNIRVSIYDNGKLVYYDWYQLQGTLEERLYKLFNFLDNTVILKWKPDYLYFEDIQYQQNSGILTFKTLAMVLGICIAVANKHSIPHKEILNKVWQQEFAISGSTRIQQKKNVVEKVKQYFNINVTDDVADAILIGNYAALHLYSNWTEDSF